MQKKKKKLNALSQEFDYFKGKGEMSYHIYLNIDTLSLEGSLEGITLPC